MQLGNKRLSPREQKVWEFAMSMAAENDDTGKITPNTYDKAMEDYLREVRCARGYTLREPSPTYDNSPNPRWRSDAQDWFTFFNLVMEYGLRVQNEYAATGNAPSLDEFKAGFPKIEWTYKEEEAE